MRLVRGVNLLSIIQCRGLSQAELGRRVGAGRQYIWKIARGHIVDVNPIVARAVERELEVPPGVLFENDHRDQLQESA